MSCVSRNKYRLVEFGAVTLVAVLGCVYEVHSSETQAFTVDSNVAFIDEQRPLEWRDLALKVAINDKKTAFIGMFKESPTGEVLIEPAELERVGIKAQADSVGNDGFVRLDKLAGVSYRLDEATQVIFFDTTTEGRSVTSIDVGNTTDPEEVVPQSHLGAVLNYTLFASTNDFANHENRDLISGASGSFDARMFSRMGVFEQSFLSGYTNGDLNGFTRLNSSWTYSDPKRMLTYKAGDLISGGHTWTRPVFLGGIQFRRNFDLRADLVTTPMPSFHGTAAVPSSIEVYNQNVQVFSGPVGEGPFQLNRLPVYTGGGETRVVLRDSLGRETETVLPFYVSPAMLRKGLIDFSFEAGFPRRNYGIETMDYDKRIYGVASVRYGLSDWLTVEGHTEVGENLINSGAGVAFPIGSWGAITMAGAGSYSKGETGGLANATLELKYGGVNFFGRLHQSFGDYNDIASVSAQPSSRLPQDWRQMSVHVPRTMAQVAVSTAGPFDFSSIGLSYNYQKTDGSKTSQTISLSYGQSIFKRASLNASAFYNIENRRDFGIFAGLSVSFDNGISTFAGLSSATGETSAVAEAYKMEETSDGGYGWRVSNAEGNISKRRVSGSYRAPFARLQAGVEQYDKQFRADAQIEGAIVAMNGDIFASRKIDDAFAVVDVGAPDVDVYSQNRPVGKSNSRGKKLITNLSGYRANSVSIDPANLPVDAVVESTRKDVIPVAGAGTVVTFGADIQGSSAIVTFIDANGAPLAEGATGVSADGRDFVVGYDGRAFLEGLNRFNKVIITIGYEKTCTAGFKFAPVRGSQSLIEGVLCQ